MDGADNFRSIAGCSAEEVKFHPQVKFAIRRLFKDFKIGEGMDNIENGAFIEIQCPGYFTDSKGLLGLGHKFQNGESLVYSRNPFKAGFHINIPWISCSLWKTIVRTLKQSNFVVKLKMKKNCQMVNSVKVFFS